MSKSLGSTAVIGSPRRFDEGIADLNVAVRELKQQTAQAKVLAKMSDLGEGSGF